MKADSGASEEFDSAPYLSSMNTFILIAALAVYVGVLTALKGLRPAVRVGFAVGAGALLLIMAWADSEAAMGARLVLIGVVIAAMLFTIRRRGQLPEQR